MATKAGVTAKTRRGRRRRLSVSSRSASRWLRRHNCSLTNASRRLPLRRCTMRRAVPFDGAVRFGLVGRNRVGRDLELLDWRRFHSGERTRFACRFRRLAENPLSESGSRSPKSRLASRRTQHASRVRSPEITSHRHSLFLVRDETFDRVLESAANHAGRIGVAFDHRFHKILRFLESDVRRQASALPDRSSLRKPPGDPRRARDPRPARRLPVYRRESRAGRASRHNSRRRNSGTVCETTYFGSPAMIRCSHVT